MGEVNSELREKNTALHTLQIESKNISNELNKVKTEISETISQKHILKEANVRLTAQLNSMVEDSNVSILYL